MSEIVLVTGGFDPLHSGHIAYLKAAKKEGQTLVVGLNSDEWLTRKKGQPFMTWTERAEIISSLSMVSRVIPFDDSDDSACDAIAKCLRMSKNNRIHFANGGDRSSSASTPEWKTYGYGQGGGLVDFSWGIGGKQKVNSSSWILEKWKTNKTERDWGYWRVLDDKGHVKVKELVINPGQSLSDQRHFYRNEHWYILEGQVKIDIQHNNAVRIITCKLNAHHSYIINQEDWHRAYNTTKAPCHILEVQYGDNCIEEDIERR